MSQLSCLVSPYRAVGVIVAVPGRIHILFKLTFLYSAATTTELSLMMSSDICMSSKRIRRRNEQITVIN